MSRHAESSGHDEESTRLVPKRKRIAIACTACRARKAKCDGRRPKCSSCEQMDFVCNFAQCESSSNMIIGKEYLSDIETRLQWIEQLLAIPRSATPSQSLSPRPTIKSSNFVQEEGIAETEGVDGIAMKAGNIFLGPSSTYAFMQEIARALDLAAQTLPERPSPISWCNDQARECMFGAETSPSTMDRCYSLQDARTLPSLQRTRSLIRDFFDHPGQACPILHRTSFIESYEEARRNDLKNAGSDWLALLNALLANALLVPQEVDANTSDRLHKAEICYERASHLCDSIRRQSPNLELVQSYILQAEYLLASRKLSHVWDTHSAVIQMAFHLGLHLPEKTDRCAPLVRDLRKRSWLGCVRLDWALSIRFGRPALISSSHVQLDLAQNSSRFSGLDLFDNDMESCRTICFNATAKLFQIGATVISHLYNGNMGSHQSIEPSRLLTHFLDLEKEMIDWKSSLPPMLGIVSFQEVVSGQKAEWALDCNRRLRTLLTLHYHGIRLLLYRRLCVKHLLESGIGSAEPAHRMLRCLELDSFERGSQSAMEIIEIMTLMMGNEAGRTPILDDWDLCVDSAFNAALVLLIHVLAQRSNYQFRPVNLDPTFVRSAVDRVISILQRLDGPTNTCARGVDFLRKTQNTVENICAPISPWPCTVAIDEGVSGQSSSYVSSGVGNTESISNSMWNDGIPISYDVDPEFDLEEFLKPDQQGL